MTNEYRIMPGFLMYFLGNENNYGLFKARAEMGDIPMEEMEGVARPRRIYKLFNVATEALKDLDHGSRVGDQCQRKRDRPLQRE